MTSIKSIIGNRPLFLIEKGATVQAAAEYMAKQNIGAIPVMESSTLVGIFSERDIINRVIAKGLNPAQISVGTVMTTNLVVANSDEDIQTSLWKMKKANCRHLPVVEGDTLIGVLSLRDLLQVEISEKQDEIEFLNSYMFHVAPGVEKRYVR